MATQTAVPHHTTLDDAQGLALGVFLSSLGVHVLAHLGLVTGQTAGLAVLFAYATGLSFGAAFFLVNLPFYVIAYRRLGASFTIKSITCVTSLSIIVEMLPQIFPLGPIHPAMGAVTFGALTGLGLLAVFRHNGSLGGVGVLALLAQDHWGLKAGYVQLATDAAIFAIAWLIFPTSIIVWSLLGAVVLNLVILLNHRRDRYIAI
ncbi:YitT family protein [Octadecabacter sp. CECT 8868]|uniref:YitT family protein n=1 Tax=Octadecabacter algicola TaxID=2909342 RepID=UPI001F288B4B|nr:YitT family protein [Octadecabacter algicola]MCF2904104.1 YitT family protein [Octadecabacter algicola]